MPPVVMLRLGKLPSEALGATGAAGAGAALAPTRCSPVGGSSNRSSRPSCGCDTAGFAGFDEGAAVPGGAALSRGGSTAAAPLDELASVLSARASEGDGSLSSRPEFNETMGDTDTA